MTMFDWYEPTQPPTCPVCGETPSEWQGTDGPNALVVWRQGSAEPVALRVDADVANLDALRSSRLPDQFWIHGSDANDHRLLILGTANLGVWSGAELKRVTQLHAGRNGRHYVRVVWGEPDPLTPRGTADR